MIGVNCSHTVRNFFASLPTTAEYWHLVRPALQPDIDQQNPATTPRCVSAGCARTWRPWQRHTALTARRRRQIAPPQPVACKHKLACVSSARAQYHGPVPRDSNLLPFSQHEPQRGVYTTTDRSCKVALHGAAVTQIKASLRPQPLVMRASAALTSRGVTPAGGAHDLPNSGPQVLLVPAAGRQRRRQLLPVVHAGQRVRARRLLAEHAAEDALQCTRAGDSSATNSSHCCRSCSTYLQLKKCTQRAGSQTGKLHVSLLSGASGGLVFCGLRAVGHGSQQEDAAVQGPALLS